MDRFEQLTNEILKVNGEIKEINGEIKNLLKQERNANEEKWLSILEDERTKLYAEKERLQKERDNLNLQTENSRKRKEVSDKENCGPTPKKLKSQSRSTILQSQNSNNNSSSYYSGNGSKGFSKANQNDVNMLLQKYSIYHVHRKNPNPQDDTFLSIFGLKVSDKFEPKVFDLISKSSETQEYDVRIQQLKDMGIFTDTKFRIKNVQKPEDGKPYKLAVPITNGILAGKTDVVIQYDINNDLGFDQYLNVVALIEFKTCDTFYSHHQGIFEYIGACIRGTLPVIYVQTDMRDFRFLVIARIADGTLALYDYLIQSTISNLNGFVILSNWLNLVHSLLKNQCRDQIILDWFIDMYRARQYIKDIADRTQDSLKNAIQTWISKEQIIDAYKSNGTKLICDELHSRTGRVYKIHIDGKAYALKVPRLTGDECKEILKELINEADIYNDLNRICDDAALWPRLHYRGVLEISEDEKWPFVILTSYLEGRKVNLKRGHKHEKCKKWEYVVANDYKLCENTLTSLNKFGIWHGDARTSNFVIVYDEKRKTERAKILDFGFSQKSTELTENLKDDETVKSLNFT